MIHVCVAISDNLLGKKYVAKVCESIQEKITEKYVQL